VSIKFRKINWGKLILNFIIAFIILIIVGLILDFIYAYIPTEGVFSDAIWLLKTFSPGVEDPVNFVLNFIYSLIFAFFRLKIKR
jgi:putative flippase GtrA